VSRIYGYLLFIEQKDRSHRERRKSPFDWFEGEWSTKHGKYEFQKREIHCQRSGEKVAVEFCASLERPITVKSKLDQVEMSFLQGSEVLQGIENDIEVQLPEFLPTRDFQLNEHDHSKLLRTVLTIVCILVPLLIFIRRKFHGEIYSFKLDL